MLSSCVNTYHYVFSSPHATLLVLAVLKPWRFCSGVMLQKPFHLSECQVNFQILHVQISSGNIVRYFCNIYQLYCQFTMELLYLSRKLEQNPCSQDSEKGGVRTLTVRRNSIHSHKMSAGKTDYYCRKLERTGPLSTVDFKMSIVFRVGAF